MTETRASYDLVGDIHGHASELKALLHKLGYEERGGAYRHPTRTAVFVGDFIDRGPEQVETVTTVRRMIDAGSALAVMGNHELNAIAWLLEDPAVPGEYLRPHHSPKYGEKNRDQHKRFLAEVETKPALHRELVDWFLTLPLWLELPGLQVVHACLHTPAMAYLEPLLAPGRRLTEALMVDATKEPADEAEKDTPTLTIFKAVEALTKGLEVPLPAPHTFRDKDGHRRDRVRVRWWDPSADTYRAAALLPDDVRLQLPELPIAAHARLTTPRTTPVFFGHYWLTDEPAPVTELAACLDYSIGKGGRLCAYRFDGEATLDTKKFVSVAKGETGGGV
jgi:hypothetical protein